MAKAELVCNHCGCCVTWYNRSQEEVGMYQIDKNRYCADCVTKIARFLVDNVNLI